MNERPLSYSAIASFLECKARFKYRYIDGLSCEDDRNRGQIVHEYIEGILKDNFKVHTDPIAAFIALNLASVIDKAVVSYDVEKEIRFTAAGKPFIAKPDLIIRRCGGEIDVVDFKSFGLSEKNILQGAVYFLAALSEYGRCDGVTFLSPVSSRTYKFEKKHVEAFLKGVIKAMEEESEYEHMPGSHCSYCSYKNVCSVYKGGDDIGQFLRYSTELKKIRSKFMNEMKEFGCIEREHGIYVYKNGQLTTGRVVNEFDGSVFNAEADE